LWKILPEIKPEIAEKVNRLPGLSVQVTDNCIGCGKCTKDVCFVNAVHLEEDHAVIDQVACRGCGRCVEVCPSNAIEITLNDLSYISRSIEKLESKVDVT
jgi:heterodisulfide reductase subunit A-like polyferredoxin